MFLHILRFAERVFDAYYSNNVLTRMDICNRCSALNPYSPDDIVH